MTQARLKRMSGGVISLLFQLNNKLDNPPSTRLSAQWFRCFYRTLGLSKNHDYLVRAKKKHHYNNLGAILTMHQNAGLALKRFPLRFGEDPCWARTRRSRETG